jgi:hypothetical protein
VYRVEVQPLHHGITQRLTLAVQGGERRDIPKETLRRQGDAAFINLGVVHAPDSTITLLITGDPLAGINQVRVTKLD